VIASASSQLNQLFTGQVLPRLGGSTSSSMRKMLYGSHPSPAWQVTYRQACLKVLSSSQA